MQILFDSKNQIYKKPFGCLRQNQNCEINIRIPRRMSALRVLLCMEDADGNCMDYTMEWTDLQEGYDCYFLEFSVAQTGLYFYFFKIETEENCFSVLRCGNTGTSIGNGDKWQLTCFSADYETPEAFRGKVMYQIFPDRFYRSGTPDLADKLKPYTVHENWSDTPFYLPNEEGEVLNNDFFGGTLQGIREKLPYLKELGVTILYINPIFMAFSNHRYDTADYRRIDPMLGTERDFELLCQSAHKLHMKIVLDGVFSHTGSNSIYFDKENVFGGGAYHCPNSPFASWYDFQQYPEQYTAWWGIRTLPCVDEMNPGYVDFIIDNEDSVIAHWMRLGADGFRLDVADELPDAFIKKLHERVKSLNAEGIVIGEVWEDASNKESYGVRRKYFSDSELDSVMNYPYKEAILRFTAGEGNAAEFAETVMTIAENYPKPVLDCLMNSLSTHDTVRVLNRFERVGEGLERDARAVYEMPPEVYQKAAEREKTAAFLQYVLPGCPCIYYGDEVGLQGFEDPFNRRCFPWEQMDMTLHAFYRKLGGIKNKYRALQTGDVAAEAVAEKVILLKRNTETETLYAVVNMGETAFSCPAEEANLLLAKETTVQSGQLCVGSGGYALFAK